MFKRIKSYFNKPSVEEKLGAFVVSDRIIKIVDKVPQPELSVGDRASYVLKIDSAKDVYIGLIERIIHEQIRFRTRNIGKPELTDMILGSLGMADIILKEIEMLSAEHQQNIEDNKEDKPQHKDYPLSSGGNIDILT